MIGEQRLPTKVVGLDPKLPGYIQRLEVRFEGIFWNHNVLVRSSWWSSSVVRILTLVSGSLKGYFGGGGHVDDLAMVWHDD